MIDFFNLGTSDGFWFPLCVQEDRFTIAQEDMNLTEWKKQFELALRFKLQIENERLKNERLLRFDVGVFPWFGCIELSFLLTKDKCLFTDIASWPYYNFSKFNEDSWPEASSLCKEMEQA